MKNKTIETIETVETIEKEKEDIKMTNTKIYTINEKMEVVEATTVGCNPTSTDKNILELFLKNNKRIMERYFDDEDRYGIAFYACGYNGKAQDEFVEGWKEVGVKVF